VFLVEKEIASTGEKLFKENMCRGDRWLDARRFRFDYLYTFLVFM